MSSGITYQKLCVCACVYDQPNNYFPYCKNIKVTAIHNEWGFYNSDVLYFSKAQGYCVKMTTVTLYNQKYDGMGFNVCLSMQLFMQMSWKLAKIHEDPDKTGL